ncbi:metallophosphoesterase [Variovorax sp. GT1P44]|uniref:metallophosphoesterase n=1 Tax=Variovorax sp. GT1P44 TaxID=3443742 RepID=UPI003F47AFFB
MTALVLHLSDIHIKSERDPILKRASEIARATYHALPEASAVLIVVSGDIAFSGRADQYAVASTFLERLRKEIQLEREIPVHFIPCPGNHDCDFSKDTTTRQMVLSGVQAKGAVAVDNSVIATCVEIQESYFAFEELLTEGVPFQRGDSLWKSYEFELEGKALTFDALNVSWASQLREEQGTLTFPHQRYEAKAKEQPDIRIAVLHQPMNWFGQATYRPFRQFLRGLSNIVMTGHEHVGVFGENTDAESGSSAYVEGWVLQGESDLSDSAFGLIELNLEDQTYRATKFAWQAGMYAPSDEGSWQDYRNLPAKQRSAFAINAGFLQLLRDPGGTFQSTVGEEVTLEDIYVYPDMQSQDEEQSRELLRASVLRDKEWLNRGVLLEGEEKVGATSLLFRLYETHHDSGLVPLYLRGSDLRNSSDKDLDVAVRRAVEEQYGAEAFLRFQQTSKERRLLLLDDFDDSPMKAVAHRSRIIGFMSRRFGQVVMTVSPLFSLGDLFTMPEGDFLKDFRRFRLLPFGYGRRAELATRWFQLTGRDGTMSESDFSSKCAASERLFNTVMVRNIIPALPLYLLTLLQGVDTGVAGSFQESALGQYYGFLLNESLRKAGVQPQRWESIIEYCSHLAWHFHGTGAKELEKSSLREFNRNFERDQHSVAFEARLEDLLRARVLVQSGDYFRFRYHYIYYYLKGRYLSKRMDDLEVQAYVKRCCKHLYARENANTLLFLAHHAYSDKFFLSCIVDALNLPFAGVPESRFDGNDTKRIATLVHDAPKLVYTGETPEQHRNRLNEEKDRLGDAPDGLAECEEDSDDLSLSAQLASTAKTVEILGQVLKNQYAVIGRSTRVEMLKQLMRGPLRGTSAILDELLNSQEFVIAELEEQLEKKAHIKDGERRKELARRILAHFLQSVAFGFIYRTAAAVSSRDLSEDIQAAAKSIGTPAARLIDLAVRLDSPEPLPRDFIRKLDEEVKADIVGGSMIRMLALQRLYMFRTTHEDKQWLASQEILDIKRVDSVSYQSRKTKSLKQ